MFRKSLMENFLIDRKHLIKNWNITPCFDSDQLPHLIINDPPLLAGFAGYLKCQCRKFGRNSRVFYRGQTRDYDLIPSLFRDFQAIGLDNDRINLRYKAYRELLQRLPLIFKAERFRNENLDAILQHYGIKTPWIDLVDNIFVAIWFAEIVFENINGLVTCKPSNEEYGWIYFFEVTDEIEYFDLREQHSSLSLRLHTQHGISATRKCQNWNTENRTMNDNLIGVVKFPITNSWSVFNQIFDIRFMFPSEELDNTYKYLKKTKVAKLLQKITTENELDENELGKIAIYGT